MRRSRQLLDSEPIIITTNRPRPAEAPGALAGLVLCGGHGRRMGRDKALIPIADTPLVVHVARRLAEVASPVMLAPGTVGRYGDLGFHEVTDAAPGSGPLGGLVAGLRAAEGCLLAVAASDMPFVSSALFRLMADEWAQEDAVIPVSEAGIEPLHAVYAPSALAALEEALRARQLGLRRALTGLRVRLIKEATWRLVEGAEGFARNLNYPADLDGLR
ncbi:MAG: molybdenum cofactor guanylyltransferase [Candidatus Dormibacteria bacterium]